MHTTCFSDSRGLHTETPPRQRPSLPPLDRNSAWTESPFWIDTYLDRYPSGQRPPWQRPLWKEHGTKGQRPILPLEGTWDQAARQEVTLYTPCEQNDWQMPVKTLHCPKFRLRALIRDYRNYFFLLKNPVNYDQFHDMRTFPWYIFVNLYFSSYDSNWTQFIFMHDCLVVDPGFPVRRQPFFSILLKVPIFLILFQTKYKMFPIIQYGHSSNSCRAYLLCRKHLHCGWTRW